MVTDTSNKHLIYHTLVDLHKLFVVSFYRHQVVYARIADWEGIEKVIHLMLIL